MGLTAFFSRLSLGLRPRDVFLESPLGRALTSRACKQLYSHEPADHMSRRSVPIPTTAGQSRTREGRRGHRESRQRWDFSEMGLTRSWPVLTSSVLLSCPPLSSLSSLCSLCSLSCLSSSVPSSLLLCVHSLLLSSVLFSPRSVSPQQTMAREPLVSMPPLCLLLSVSLLSSLRAQHPRRWARR